MSFQTDSELTVEEKDESVAKIFFDPADYRVLENCGLAELKVCCLSFLLQHHFCNAPHHRKPALSFVSSEQNTISFSSRLGCLKIESYSNKMLTKCMNAILQKERPIVVEKVIFANISVISEHNLSAEKML